MKVQRKLHYKNFNEFLKLYGNLEWEDYRFMFREFLDGYNTLNKEQKINFLRDIDFNLIPSKRIRAYTNSAIRHIITNDKEFTIKDIEIFSNYFTNKYVLKDPWYPKYARGYLKIYCTQRTAPEFMANNVMFGENPASVI